MSAFAPHRCIATVTLALTLAIGAAGCGSKGDESSPAAGGAAPATLQGSSAPDGGSGGLSATEPDQPTTTRDASRILAQASFGATATTLAEVQAVGARKYVLQQMDAPVSQYAYATTQSDNRARVHKHGSSDVSFCDAQMPGATDNCWRDYYSPHPVQREFYRQAVSNPDQLRQRMAFALSQILVTSARELDTSYGFAHYHQTLRENAFGNYRTVLERVTLSPFMGAYLNMVDNDKAEPNENYARELLQLFTIGTCELNLDGTLKGGSCVETYDNDKVRNYAFALTGWTFPGGGVDPWCSSSCQEQRWTNPRFYRGEMVARDGEHDQTARPLLSGVTAPAGRSARQGLDAVLDSLLAHPNIGPFIGRQLIQFFVTSNPTPAYVARVATAFNSGRFGSGDRPVGTGRRGDLRATLAAVLLDPEARTDDAAADGRYGRLREPVQIVAGALRALDGVTDGDAVGADWAWTGLMEQAPFNAPSVFNYYPPDFPLAGTALVAPQMGSESANTALARVNYGNALIYWWGERGTDVNGSLGDGFGTRVNFGRWEALIVDHQDSAKAVDAIDLLLTGGRLAASEKAAIVSAMDSWTPDMRWLETQPVPSNWRRERIKTAFYLILASAAYQVQR